MTRTRTRYPNLARFDWPTGVYKSPIGYEHPWLVVFEDRTEGFWNERDATRARAVGAVGVESRGQHRLDVADPA